MNEDVEKIERELTLILGSWGWGEKTIAEYIAKNFVRRITPPTAPKVKINKVMADLPNGNQIGYGSMSIDEPTPEPLEGEIENGL